MRCLTCVGLRQVRDGQTEIVDGELEVQELIKLRGELVLTDEVRLEAGVERGDDGGDGVGPDLDEVVAGAAGETDEVLAVLRLHRADVAGDLVVAGLAAVHLAGWRSLLAQISLDVGEMSEDYVGEGLVTRRGADVVTEQLQVVDVGRVGAERLEGVREDDVQRPPRPRLSGGQVEVRPGHLGGHQDHRQEEGCQDHLEHTWVQFAGYNINADGGMVRFGC